MGQAVPGASEAYRSYALHHDVAVTAEALQSADLSLAQAYIYADALVSDSMSLPLTDLQKSNLASLRADPIAQSVWNQLRPSSDHSAGAATEGRVNQTAQQTELGFADSNSNRPIERSSAAQTQISNAEKGEGQSGNLDIANNGGIIELEGYASADDKPYQIRYPREKRIELINRGVSQPTTIFAKDTANNRFASSVAHVPKKEGFYDVAIHGRETSVDFYGTPIDAYTLAKIILQRKDYKRGTPVRLLSCNTGNTTNTGNCFAQLLANELDVDVEAATDVLYVTVNEFGVGEFVVGKDNVGEMKMFYSRKVENMR